VNPFTHLVDQLTKGFQSADDQFQALQTQVTKGFQSMDSQFQELEAEVAQIQIYVQNTPRHLTPKDQ
jgi:phage shock protein A